MEALIKKLKSIKYTKKTIKKMGYRDAFKAMGFNYALKEIEEWAKSK